MSAPMLRTPRPYPGRSPCDLCGSQMFELVAERDRRKRAWHTVVCRVCGLLAHAQIPTEVELANYYRREYRLDYHGEYVPSPHRVVREWNRGRQLLRMLVGHVHPGARVVEIGCGLGCTVKNFELAGYHATGIEPGEGFRRFAVESLKARVQPGVLASMPRQADYDLVLLVHVLEHLRSPSQSLTHIRSMLRDGGQLYVEVPNAGAPHAAPGKMFHFAHIYNFTRDTLEMLAERCGFRVGRWLSSPQDKNLRVLLACGSVKNSIVEPASYRRTMQAVTGLTTVGYHLRWSYLRERLRTIMGHPSDHVLAGRRLRRILEVCQSAVPATAEGSRRHVDFVHATRPSCS